MRYICWIPYLVAVRNFVAVNTVTISKASHISVTEENKIVQGLTSGIQGKQISVPGSWIEGRGK